MKLFAKWVDVDPRSLGAWTPRQFSVDRRNTKSRADGVDRVGLYDLVRSDGGKRRTRKWSKGVTYIGVPHVIGEGMLDAAAIRSYEPITPGFVVQPGEVLVSCINPRIPRVFVVPQISGTILCSSEFAALIPGDRLESYTLAYLLRGNDAVRQMTAMTSGTSASHARIKERQLLEIELDIPARGSEAGRKLKKIVAAYQTACESIWTAQADIQRCREQEEDWSKA